MANQWRWLCVCIAISQIMFFLHEHNAVWVASSVGTWFCLPHTMQLNKMLAICADLAIGLCMVKGNSPDNIRNLRTSYRWSLVTTDCMTLPGLFCMILATYPEVVSEWCFPYSHALVQLVHIQPVYSDFVDRKKESKGKITSDKIKNSGFLTSASY